MSTTSNILSTMSVASATTNSALTTTSSVPINCETLRNECVKQMPNPSTGDFLCMNAGGNIAGICIDKPTKKLYTGFRRELNLPPLLVGKVDDTLCAKFGLDCGQACGGGPQFVCAMLQKNDTAAGICYCGSKFITALPGYQLVQNSEENGTASMTMTSGEEGTRTMSMTTPFVTGKSSSGNRSMTVQMRLNLLLVVMSLVFSALFV